MKTQIVIHHTASPRDTSIDQIDKWHREKDWGGGIRGQKSELGHYAQYHWVVCLIKGKWKAIQVSNEHEHR